MPSPLDAPARTISANLVGVFGGRAVYRTETGGVPDPSTGGFATEPTATETVTKAIPADARFSSFDDSLVQAGDRVVFVAASTIPNAPVPGEDTIDLGAIGSTVRWRVVASETVSGGDSDALYELLLRK